MKQFPPYVQEQIREANILQSKIEKLLKSIRMPWWEKLIRSLFFNN